MILTYGSNPEQVALTFDDGPNGFDTLAILRVLEKRKAKATFFMLGKWVQEQPGIAQSVKFAGHEIGNHTFSHRALDQLADLQVDHEILSCQQALVDWQGIAATVPKWFRPPYGRNAERAEKFAEAYGLKTVLWSQLSGDWAAKTPEEILAKVDLDTDKGEIVLLHDGGPEKLGADRGATVQAVEMILEKWPNKQYVTVSELEV